jgi:DNA-binding MarR family transcriptional regulator
VGVKGKTVQRYVGKKEDEGLVRKLKNYREFRRRRHELNRLNRQIDQEWNRLEESLIEGKIQ